MKKKKPCTICGKKQFLLQFYDAPGNRDGLKNQCKGCYKIRRIGSEYRKTIIERRRADRRAAIEFYGGKCACCGETQYEFLSIDHVDGGGAKHRKEVGTNIGLWLKRNGYPVGFRVLCHNCNQAIGFYGFCPHAEKRREQM